MHKLRSVAIAIVTFAAGGLLGFVVSREAYQASLATYEMADIDHMSTYVNIQRFKGTREAYERSLHDLLLALDARERAGSGLYSGHITAVDKALTYTRLSLLAKVHGDLDEAADYRAKAEALCPQTGWESCSAHQLTEVVERIDKNSIWKPIPLKILPSDGS